MPRWIKLVRNILGEIPVRENGQDTSEPEGREKRKEGRLGAI